MERWPKALARLEGAYSDNTLRSYRVGYGAFSSWCRRRRVKSLPASPQTIAAYIAAESERLKFSTLKQRLCAIRKVHWLFDHPDPTRYRDVDLAIRRAARIMPSRPRQALGITANMRDLLLGACGDDLIGLRDKVLVSVGFDTLCRRGELVSICIDDLTKTDSGRYQVLVRRAKNDPQGLGRVCFLSRRSSALIDCWVNTIGADRGALLRPVYGHRALSCHLSASTVSRILKHLASRVVAADVGSKISGHSLRVGAAQQLTIDGRDILQVMRAGGWRSTNVVARYIENVDVDVWD